MTGVVAASVVRWPAVPTLIAGSAGTVGLAAGATALVTDSGSAGRGHLVEDAVVAVVWALLTLWVGWSVPRAPVLPLFAATAVAAALTTAAGTWWQLTGAVVAGWVSGWSWPVSTFLPVTLLLLAVPGPPVTAGRRAGAGVSVAGIALVCLAGATAAEVGDPAGMPVANPFALPALEPLATTGLVLVGVGSLVALTSLLTRARGDDPSRTAAHRLLAAVGAASVLALVLAGALGERGWVLQLVSTPLLALAVAVAVVRHRLFGVDVVLRRSVVFAGLVVLVVAGYALVVAAAATLLQHRAGFWASVVAAGAVAVAFHPVRVPLERLVSRGLFGLRDRPHTWSVGWPTSGTGDEQEVLHRAVDDIASGLRLPWVAVRTGSASVASAVRPAWAGDHLLVRVPLGARPGEDPGELVAAPRSRGERLERADLLALEAAAVPLAAIVTALRLTGELRLSRDAVVTAREEERRRLRAELHDAVGPLLSAVVAHVDVARLRLERDPDGAVEVLDRAGRASRSQSPPCVRWWRTSAPRAWTTSVWRRRSARPRTCWPSRRSRCGWWPRSSASCLPPSRRRRTASRWRPSPTHCATPGRPSWRCG